MVYRLATKRDSRKIADLRWESNSEASGRLVESYDGYIERCRKFISRGIRNGSWFYWIAEEGMEIRGIIAIYKFERMPAPGRPHAYNGYITNVYVRNGYRSNGIGKEILSRVKRWAAEEQINVLMLYSSNDAKGFYEQDGFSNNDEFYNLILNDE